MTLNFPNRSRSFEAKRDRVRFWGYDSAIEITFFVEGTVLRKLCPQADLTEAGFLQAFDTMLDRIRHAAGRAYARGPRGAYAFGLSEGDF